MGVLSALRAQAAEIFVDAGQAGQQRVSTPQYRLENTTKYVRSSRALHCSELIYREQQGSSLFRTDILMLSFVLNSHSDIVWCRNDTVLRRIH